MIKKEDWKTEPIPDAREDLGYQNFFWDSDAEKLLAGYKPTDMEDKWFVYSQEGWVYFVRSWTGHHIFAIKLAGSSAGGANVIASWVNTNQKQYRSQGREQDIKLLNGIIKGRFNIETSA